MLTQIATPLSPRAHTLLASIRTPLGEVDGLLVGADSGSRSLLGGQAAADGTSLLVAEVEGKVLRLLVELAEVLALLLVDDGEDTGDRLADSVAGGGVSIVSSCLVQPTSSCLRLRQHGAHMRANASPTRGTARGWSRTYILVSFEAEPPTAFCTRRLASSVRSSSSWVRRSCLFLRNGQHNVLCSALGHGRHSVLRALGGCASAQVVCASVVSPQASIFQQHVRVRSLLLGRPSLHALRSRRRPSHAHTPACPFGAGTVGPVLLAVRTSRQAR
jgi:hypothetical protein